MSDTIGWLGPTYSQCRVHARHMVGGCNSDLTNNNSVHAEWMGSVSRLVPFPVSQGVTSPSSLSHTAECYLIASWHQHQLAPPSHLASSRSPRPPDGGTCS
jgi:hypothetical protein